MFPHGARDGNRTRTDITVNRILSPARLPIPPPERVKGLQKYTNIFGIQLISQHFCNSFLNNGRGFIDLSFVDNQWRRKSNDMGMGLFC